MVGKVKFLVCLVMIVTLMVVLTSIGVNAEEQLVIGIIQIVEHPALDQARQGFIDLLADHGFIKGQNVTYDYQNAQGDMATTNTIAQKFSWEEPDLILAIATPTAQAVANVIKDIPILITAVTDPVDAGLVESMERPNTNVTGTTDMTPIAKQLELLLEIKPTVKKIGMVYNAGESNSALQVKITRSLCQEMGLTLVEATADNSSSVNQAAQSLANRVDALYVATDNTVAAAIETVVMVAEEYQLPLIVGEEAMVARGGLATEGISYYQLGRQTGEMALKVLVEGVDPAGMPIESQQQTRLVINQSAAEKIGLVLTEHLTERAFHLY
ncbi:MAG: ABC transporter substrate-binding protein [Halanaerobiales bacterium]|nr:ABC transporter substrate-binding protein [Halanaerobiales bacterium]